ncbi:MAG TPA: hypothetical protein VK447_18435 [Myxococcaceae bacterium]|nr:hypothetical protein [Myxococcaceae bacterium]
MLIERPERPQGRHVALLRNHLGINQTSFGALLETAQTTVSQWEHPARKEELLPQPLAARLLEVWDCFPTRPAGGFTEMMAVLSAYRMGHAGGWRGPSVEMPPGFLELSYPPGRTGPRVLIQDRHQGDGGGASPPSQGPSAEQGMRPGARQDPSSPGVAPRTSHAPGGFTFGFAVATGLAVFALTTGCMLSHRPPARSCVPEPEQVHRHLTGGAADDAGGPNMGTKPSSIPMPKKPYAWQKVGPCDKARGEVEKVGGCWSELASPAPCPRTAVESEGRCYVPTPAERDVPNTVTPAP